VEIDIANEPAPGGVAVRVRVRLSAREASRLFLSGDALIQLPADGALPADDGAPILRPSIFLSQLAGSGDGVVRTFSSEAAARAFATAVGSQLTTALEAL